MATPFNQNVIAGIQDKDDVVSLLREYNEDLFASFDDDLLVSYAKRRHPELFRDKNFAQREVQYEDTGRNIAQNIASYGLLGFGEDAPNWMKQAYNESVTGLLEYAMTGKIAYEVDEDYDGNLLEEAGSFLLGFAFPADIASFWVGGKAAGTVASKTIMKTTGKTVVKHAEKNMAKYVTDIVGGVSKEWTKEAIEKEASRLVMQGFSDPRVWKNGLTKFGLDGVKYNILKPFSKSTKFIQRGSRMGGQLAAHTALRTTAEIMLEKGKELQNRTGGEWEIVYPNTAEDFGRITKAAGISAITGFLASGTAGFVGDIPVPSTGFGLLSKKTSDRIIKGSATLAEIATFGTVEPLLHGEPLTMEGYKNAAFAIGTFKTFNYGIGKLTRSWQESKFKKKVERKKLETEIKVAEKLLESTENQEVKEVIGTELEELKERHKSTNERITQGEKDLTKEDQQLIASGKEKAARGEKPTVEEAAAIKKNVDLLDTHLTEEKGKLKEGKELPEELAEMQDVVDSLKGILEGKDVGEVNSLKPKESKVLTDTNIDNADPKVIESASKKAEAGEKISPEEQAEVTKAKTTISDQIKEINKKLEKENLSIEEETSLNEQLKDKENTLNTLDNIEKSTQVEGTMSDGVTAKIKRATSDMEGVLTLSDGAIEKSKKSYWEMLDESKTTLKEAEGGVLSQDPKIARLREATIKLDKKLGERPEAEPSKPALEKYEAMSDNAFVRLLKEKLKWEDKEVKDYFEKNENGDWVSIKGKEGDFSGREKAIRSLEDATSDMSAFDPSRKYQYARDKLFDKDGNPKEGITAEEGERILHIAAETGLRKTNLGGLLRVIKKMRESGIKDPVTKILTDYNPFLGWLNKQKTTNSAERTQLKGIAEALFPKKFRLLEDVIDKLEISHRDRALPEPSAIMKVKKFIKGLFYRGKKEGDPSVDPSTTFDAIDMKSKNKKKHTYTKGEISLFRYLKAMWGHRNIGLVSLTSDSVIWGTKAEKVMEKVAKRKKLNEVEQKIFDGALPIALRVNEKKTKKQIKDVAYRVLYDVNLQKDVKYLWERALKSSKKENWLLGGPDGGKLSDVKIRIMYDNFVTGGGDATPHSIRHTLISAAQALDELNNTNYEKWVSKHVLMHSKAFSASDKSYLTKTAETKKDKKMFLEFHEDFKKYADEISFKDKDVKALEELIGLETGKDKVIYQETTNRVGEVSKENYTLLKEKEFQAEISRLEKENPGLKLAISKDKNYSGSFFKGVIEVVLGKADRTTFYHENVHRLEGFLRQIGNKKLISQWERGVKIIEHSKEFKQAKAKNPELTASEYLTQLSAEMGLAWKQAKGIKQKLYQWGKHLFSSIKSFFGIANERDIARVFGKKAVKGFSTEGIKREKLGMKKLFQDKSPFSKNKHNEVVKAITKTQEEYGLTTDQVRDFIATSGLGKGNKKQKFLGLIGKTPEETKGNVALLIAGIELNFKKYEDSNVNGYQEAFIHASQGLAKGANPTLKKGFFNWGRWAAPTSAVLKIVGGKPGERLAGKFDTFYMDKQTFIGKGDMYRHAMLKHISRSDLNNKMWVMDRKIAKEGLTPAEIEFQNKMFNDPSSGAYKAKELLTALNNELYSSLENSIKENFNPATAEKIIAKLKKQKVQDYYTRKLSKQAKDYYVGADGQMKIRKLVNKTLEKRCTTDESWSKREEYNQLGEDLGKTNNRITKLKKEQGKGYKEKIAELEERQQHLRDKRGELLDAYQKEHFDEIYNDIHNKFEFGNKRFVTPNIDYGRIDLPEFTIDKASGKRFRTYETKFDATVGMYIDNMSHLIAGVKSFPELMKLTSSSGKNITNAVIAHFRTYNEGGNEFSKWVQAAVETEVLRKRSTDGVLAPITRVMGRIAQVSGVLGLSSPFAGVKNYALGDVQILGQLGGKHLAAGYRAMLDSNSWDIVRKSGAFQLSTSSMRELGVHRNILKYVSLMQPTEQANRVKGAFAMISYVADGIQILNGKKGGMFKNMKKDTVLDIFVDTLKLTKEEIAVLKEYGIEPSNIPSSHSKFELVNKVHKEAMRKVIHNGHITTQGATGTMQLPLWLSRGAARPLSLFYRMAYSVTVNMKNNILNPLVKHRNPIPLVRYGIGSMLYGKALWSLYDIVLGVEQPHEVSEDAAKGFVEYGTRTEMLGMLTNTIGPTRRGESILSSFEPVILRNVMGLFDNTMAFWNETKTFMQATSDLSTTSIVLVNHANRAYTKATNPFKTNYKRVKTIERAFLTEYKEKTGVSGSYTPGGKISAYYRPLREAILSQNYKDVAKAYWAAYHYLVDIQTEMGEPLGEAKKDAKQQLNTVIRSMAPLSKMSNNSTEGRLARKAFNEWISDDRAYLIRKATKEWEANLKKVWLGINDFNKQRKMDKYF